MREDDLIKSVEPIIDEITALNQKIDNVKTIKGDKGDEGEKGEQGAQGETGQEGIGVNTKEWSKGIYREGQIVQHFIGQQFKALKDTDKEPSHGEDWERIGTTGFRWTGVKSDKAKYQDGDLFIDSGTTFLMVDGKAKMFAQRGKNAVDGKNGVDGKAAREFVHVKWHSKGISFVYDDGEIVEADVDGLNEIQKRMTFIEEMFESNESIDAPIKRYAGVYKINKSYAVGDTVTEAKSLYLCIKADANSNSLDLDKWVKICNAQVSGGKGGGGDGTTVDAYTKAQTDSKLNLKADKADTYTKTEADSLFGGSGGDGSGESVDAYTKGETDTLLDTKANVGDSYKKDETYSNTEVDGKLFEKADKTTTYTKEEVDASQKAQDTKIDKNKADIATNKSAIASNSSAIGANSARITSSENDIVELEEEIEALAPSFDRGHWSHDPTTGVAGRAPTTGSYYLGDKDAMVTQLFGETEQVYFHNTDSEDPPQTHTFADVQEGMYIEMFNGLDSSFLLGVVETVTTGVTHTIIDVTVVKAEGGATELDATATSLTDGVRVKFFNMTEGELSLDGYMQTSGGTFTGLVKHKKEIVIEPSLPSRFVNIKNRYATNADGTNSGGSDNQNFGINFDLDHGNSGYNTVQWSTRNGNVFAVYGGTGANAKYTGKMTEDSHLVNKGFIVPKEGGTFTGKVLFNKPFSNSTESSGFTVKGAISDDYSATVSEQNGDMLSVYHNSNAADAVNYRGKITAAKNIATKEYVDNSIVSATGELYTLSTCGNHYTFNNGLDAPTNTSFRTDTSSHSSLKEFHFKQLWTSENEIALLNANWQPTPSTVLELYIRAELVMKTTIKDWKTSTRNNNCVMFNLSGSQPCTHLHGYLYNNSTYEVILTNMRKK